MKMKKTFQQLEKENYILCTPKDVKADMGMVGTYKNNLKVCTNQITLNAIPAKLFLEKGRVAVDDNGTHITLLDSDIDKKLVIIEDLNLFIAICQTQQIQNVWVDILDNPQRSKRWSF